MRILSLLIFLLLIFAIACTSPQNFDTMILGGTLIDGTGNPRQDADIGLNGDSIAFIGDASAIQYNAKSVVDVSGYLLTPGYIDPHTHAFNDLSDEEKSANLNFLMQGVTTVITGNDGAGPIEIDDVISSLKKNGIGTNAALLVGHGTVRKNVMGMSSEVPTSEQLEEMKSLITNAMEQGALGMSTGLYYAPGSFAQTDEVIELAKVVAEFGGYYDSHIRDESSYNIGLIGAIKEVIRIAEEADIPVHVAHIKALGVDVWGKSSEVIELANEARSRGIDFTADQYPYNASGTSITASLVPKWVRENVDDFTTRFDDPDLIEKIKTDMSDNLRRRGGPASLLITRSPIEGIVKKTLEQVANQWELDPIAAAIRIIRQGNASVASFNMHPDDIANFMQQPWVMTGSDGSAGHPRKYGTYPKKITEFVINDKILIMEEFVHRSSGLVAAELGIKKRGIIKIGNKADILVFKPEEIKNNATFDDPEVMAEGMYHIWINGQQVIENGIYSGKKAGLPLKR